jgi:hypothetical protein
MKINKCDQREFLLISSRMYWLQQEWGRFFIIYSSFYLIIHIFHSQLLFSRHYRYKGNLLNKITNFTRLNEIMSMHDVTKRRSFDLKSAKTRLKQNKKYYSVHHLAVVLTLFYSYRSQHCPGNTLLLLLLTISIKCKIKHYNTFLTNTFLTKALNKKCPIE